MQITDSQVHIWQPETPDKPWPTGGHQPDWAFTPFGAEDLIAEMDAAGVTRAMLIPPAFDGGRNDYAVASANRYPGRFGVVGRLALGATDAPERMAEWAEEKHGYGMRFAFFLPEQKAQLASGEIDWLWPLAEKLDMPLMIYPTHDLIEELGKIANRYQGLRITIDHMAVGHTEQDRDEAAFVHMAQLKAIAKLPNVAIKASAAPEYSTKGYPWANLHAPIREIVDAFGPERVFWGTDMPRLTATYREAVTMFTEEMTWLNEAELELVMDKGLRKWHGWDIPGA